MPAADAPPTTLTPYLTQAHHHLWSLAEEFTARHVTPRVARMEAAPHRAERTLPRLMAKRGWFGVTLPTEYGGLAAGHVARTVLIHRLSLASAAAGTILQAHLIPAGALLHWGTTEQKTRWLRQVAEGVVLMTIAVTEPEAGGHIGGIETTAEPADGGWRITGEKAHIGNSHLAHLHVVVARTAPPHTRTPASQALTAFLVEADRKGVTTSPPRTRLGLHGFTADPPPRLGLHGFTAGRLRLDRVHIPAANILGTIGEGMDVAQSSSILYGRPNLTAVSLGLHEALVSRTTAWLANRPRYGAHLADLPVVRDRLGTMQARLQHARVITYHAVHLLDRGLPCDSDLIAAKHTSHQLAADTARDAMELHGAHALDTHHDLPRLWRDIQHTYAPAGTGEVQRIHLAKTALNTGTVQWSARLAQTLTRTRPSPDPAPA